MKIEVTVRYHDDRLHRKVGEILRLLRATRRLETYMAGELDALQAQVERNAEVDQSAITLLQGIKAALDAAIASGDPTRIQALSDSLGASTDALAAAVLANTPGQP